MITNNNERTPSEDSHEPILNPEQTHFEEMREQSSMGLKLAVVLFILVACIAVGYGWLQHNTAQQLAAERADLRASLAQAKTQEDELTAKVNALTAAQAEAQLQQEAARVQAEMKADETVKNEQFPPRTSEAQRHPTHHAATRRAADDPRWKQVQQQLGEQQKQLADSQKQIADTQANLEQAKTDLAGNLHRRGPTWAATSPATTMNWWPCRRKASATITSLASKSPRAYHHTGPISIALRKADTKHEFCDLQLVVDDKEITRKHVNLYESVSFYPEGYPLPLEVGHQPH